MNKPKLVTVVGTRPEIIRLSRLIPRLDLTFDQTLINTTQNSDPKLNHDFFRDLNLREPDLWLETSNASFYQNMSDVIAQIGVQLERLAPDAFVVLGDTNSAIALLVAKRLGIPTYHLEAGNRSFDENVPEEINRRLVDHVSDFNLPYNRFSEANLLREGIHPRFIFQSGSPLREVLNHYQSTIAKSSALVECGVKPGSYILASIHRQENVDRPSRLIAVLDTLEQAASALGKKVLLSTHPRTLNRIQATKFDATNIKLHPPFVFTDYVKLQTEAYCVVSDSGTISEEASMIGFPAVTIRNSMERPEALETGGILMSPAEPQALTRAIEESRKLTPSKSPDGYSEPNFSENVARFVLSTYSLVRDWKGIRSA